MSQELSTTEIIFDAEKINSITTMATIMSKGLTTLPKHLRGNPADCMAVIIQAMQWKMNPFSVAQKTHLVNGNLGYEAQLVNAVVQSSGIIKDAFEYEYNGEGQQLACRVTGTLQSGKVVTGEWLSLSQVRVKNSPLWATNPRQQLGYLQVKNWVRLYFPSALLGVYTTDELEPVKEIKGIVESPYIDPLIELKRELKKLGVSSKEEYSQFMKFSGITAPYPISELPEIYNEFINSENKPKKTLKEELDAAKQRPDNSASDGEITEPVPEVQV